ncbi:MAG: hypothetical protein CO132_03575 [Candidatus Kerfeldbacteria bacterium CG_4_9_14_3_um_filter_45_8]|nr:MAG: hypothetical protein CO132_03575 [Candidatus Kerfeldbacteria bacterium CG_4_9_14_3_um_filter_45_8]
MLLIMEEYHRKFTGIMGATILVASFFCTQPVFANDAPQGGVGEEVITGAGKPEYATDRLVVRYKDGRAPNNNVKENEVKIDEGVAQRLLSAQDKPKRNYWSVELAEGESLTQSMLDLSNDPNVATVELDLVRRATGSVTATTPDDTNFNSQWHLDELPGINAQEAWDTQTGSNSVVIAIIDSGVDTDHPDLSDNMWVNPGEIASNGLDDDLNGYIDDVYGYDFSDSDGDPNPAPDGIDNDSSGSADGGVFHGTHVAGIAAAVGNNTLGIAGVSWDAQIMALRVLSDEGSGFDSDIAEAIDYAVANGADIINLSLGGESSTSILQTAVADAIAAGVLVVAAAGNDGGSLATTPFYPVCYDSVLGVGSTNSTGGASSFTNYGTDCVDIYAPGSSIYSTYYTDDAVYGFTTDYGFASGTSMATPVVVGVAGLLYANNSGLTQVTSKNILTTTAVNIDSQFSSAVYEGPPFIDADRALLLADCVSGSSIVGDTTYFEDLDNDGLGNPESSKDSCAEPGDGWVVNDTDTNDNDADNDGVDTELDCDDSDSTVSEDQAYYLDEDSDGLGNPELSTLLCSATAPDGYVDNANDTNDDVVNNDVEIDDDNIDNDGDGEVDEVNNGVHPGYDSTDPTSASDFDLNIQSVTGKKHGKVQVKFADDSVFVYRPFSVTSSKVTQLVRYPGSAYFVVMHPKGKQVTLLNPYNGEKVSTKKLSKKKVYTVHAIKVGQAPTGGSKEAVSVSKKQAAVLVALIRVNVNKGKLVIKDKVKVTESAVKPSKTKISKGKIKLRSKKAKLLLRYKVTKKYQLKLLGS